MSTNKTDNKIRLRLYYWNVRGRIQGVRYMLEDIAGNNPNVEYQDDFEIFENAAEKWPAHKTDKTISGPFGNLPVLHIDETHVIAQTLPIGQYLARRFGKYGKPRSVDEDPIIFQGLIDGVVSCSYTDVIMSVFLILYNQVDLNDPSHPYALLVKKVAGDLKMLNNLLATSSTSFFYDQDEPTIADYFTFYGFTLAKDLHPALLPSEENATALNKLEEVMKSRPALAKYFSEDRLPKRFSGSPTEESYRAKLSAKQN